MRLGLLGCVLALIACWKWQMKDGRVFKSKRIERTVRRVAKSKGARRVIGRNGENMQIDGEDICFKTDNKVERIPLEALSDIEICNTEQARNAVTTEDLVPYGRWTKEMPSVGGKSVFLVVRGPASLWVMEINKSQVPNASAFVDGVRPTDENEDENKLRIPNRAINTPLGAVFTVGTIACIVVAIFLVYSFKQPLWGLLAAAAAIVMYINIK